MVSLRLVMTCDEQVDLVCDRFTFGFLAHSFEELPVHAINDILGLRHVFSRLTELAGID